MPCRCRRLDPDRHVPPHPGGRLRDSVHRLDLTTEGRHVAVIFADGAGAVVLDRPRPRTGEFLAFDLHSEGALAEKLWSTAQDRCLTRESRPSTWRPPPVLEMDGRGVPARGGAVPESVRLF